VLPRLTSLSAVALQLRSRAIASATRSFRGKLKKVNSSATSPALQLLHKPESEALIRSASKTSKPGSTELPGWLSSLALCGAGAVVIALNTDQVPVNGRRQLLCGTYRPPKHGPNPEGLPNSSKSEARSLGSFPRAATRLPAFGFGCHELQQQGLEVKKDLTQHQQIVPTPLQSMTVLSKFAWLDCPAPWQ